MDKISFGIFVHKISYKKAYLLIAISAILVAVLAIPIQLTVDGIFYVASSKSFFSKEFGEMYSWFREPGYPIFLRAIHLLGNNGQYVVVVQAFLMSAAVSIGLYIVKRITDSQKINTSIVIVVILLTINPIFIQYSANFLQQALFTFYLALFALFAEFGRVKPSKLKMSILISSLILFYCLTVLTSIGWLYLGLFPIALFWLNVFINSNKIHSKIKSLISILTISAIATAGTYGLGRLTYFAWEEYKKPFVASVDYQPYVIKPLSGLPELVRPIDFPERFFALMDFTHIDPYEPQNEIFLGVAMSTPLSQYDGAYINKPTTEYAPGYFILPSASIGIHKIYSKLTNPEFSLFVYQATFGIMLLGVFIFFVRREWQLLSYSLIPISFISIHAANNTVVDRYGIPAFSFAIVITSYLIAQLGRSVYHKISKSKSR